MKQGLDYSKTAPDGITAWREPPFYSEREQAALAWTESVTRISEDRVSDDIYHQVKQHFIEKELVDLTLAAIAINSWNRLAISFPTPTGSYQPDHPVSEKNLLRDRLDLTVWTLRRPDHMIDRWDGQIYPLDEFW